MSMHMGVGCELSKAAKNDLKKAIRCLLVAGMACATTWSGESDAQEVAPGYEGATTLERVQAIALKLESTKSFNITPISPNNVAFWLDGVRTGDTFLGSNDTEGYDEDPSQEPVPKPNPEPRKTPCGAEDSTSAFDAVVNNPVDVVDGYKHMSATDFQSITNPLLQLTRYKNPRWKGQGVLGQSWVTNLDTKISFTDVNSSCYPAPGKPSCNMSSPKLINFYTERGGIVQLERVATSNTWRGKGAAERYWISKGNDGEFILRIRDSAFSPKYVFHKNGFAKSIDMRDGNRLTYTYDTSNRLTQVTHNSGRYIALSWTAAVPTAVASITAPNLEVYRFEYYTAGTNYVGVEAPILRRVIYPDGKGNIEYVHEQGTHTIFGDPRPYTNAHKLLQIKINNVPVKNYTYKLFVNNTAAIATTSFADGTELYQYNYLRGVQSTREVINPHGKKTTYVVEDGKITEVIGALSPNCPATFKSASYDADGMTQHTVNERDVVTTYEYDDYGRKIKQIEAAGTPEQRVTRWIYDSDPSNVLRTDLLKKEIVEGVSETTYEYTTSDILGDAMYASVSVRNLSQNGVNGQEHRTTYSYTSHPNGVVATVSEDGPVPGIGDRVIKQYNSLGDLIEVENSLGHKRTFSGHNGFGQPARIVNENGDIHEYQYDARGRIVVESAVVNGQAQETRYVYGSAGRLATIEMPDNVTLTRQYDAAGRVLREYQNEAGGTFAVKRYTYNNASQITSVKVQRTTAVVKPSGTPAVSISGGPSGNYTVTWSGSSGVENYQLQEMFDGGSWSTSNQGLSTGKVFSGRAEGIYIYRARACNAEGCTAYSPEKSVEVVHPPTSAPTTFNVPETNNNGSFTVSWSSVSAANRYELQQRKDSPTFSTIYNSSGTSKALSGLTNGIYEYRVRACNEGGCAAYTPVKTTEVTFPPTSAPTTFNVPTTNNNGSFTVSWSSVSAATRYELQQSKDSPTFSTIYNSSGTSKALSGLTNGNYGYRVRACNAGGCAAYTPIKTTVVTHPPSSAPTTFNVPATNNSGSFTVSWSSVGGATDYSLWQREDGDTSGPYQKPWQQIYSGAALSKAVSGLINGGYEFKVQACNAGGCSPDSVVKPTVVTFPPTSAPTTFNVPATNNNGSFTVSWSSVSAANRYELQQRKDSPTFSTIYNSSGTSKALSGLTNGIYEYRVRACNEGGCAAYTPVKTTEVTFPPTSAPTTFNVPATNNNGSFTVSWSSVSAATRYELQQSKDSPTFSTIYNSSGTSKALSGLTNGNYGYQVRACNAGGCAAYTPIKTTVVTHPPGTPTVTAPSADNNGAFTVSWGSVSTTTQYRLEQRKDGGTWSQIYSGTALSKAVSGLTNGSYGYRARACNAGGCSSYSAIKTTVVTFPPSSAPSLSAPTSADTYQSFTVSWTAVSTATSYELQVSLYGSGWSTVYNGANRSVSRQHNHDGSYSYQARACNVGGCGPFSGTRTVHVVDIGGGGPCFEGVCPEPKAVDPVGEEM